MYRCNGRWAQKVKINDGWKVVYGKTQKELRDKLSSLSHHSVSFHTASEEWAKEHYPTLSPGTIRGYETARLRAEELGEIPLDEIRPIDITRYINSVVKKYRMCHGVAKKHLGIVHMICRYAVQQGYIDNDPSISVALPSGLKKGRRGLPDPNDVEIIKKSADIEFGLFPLIALYTGMRKSEILALRKEDIDLENQVIYVTKSLFSVSSSTPVLKAPKTENGVRIVGIPKPLVAHLQNIPDGFIFNVNGQPLTESQFQVKWVRYVRHTGISCTPHQLRHEYTSVLIESGLTPEEAQILVGHSSYATTMDIYKHLKHERSIKIAKKASELNF